MAKIDPVAPKNQKAEPAEEVEALSGAEATSNMNATTRKTRWSKLAGNTNATTRKTRWSRLALNTNATTRKTRWSRLAGNTNATTRSTV